MGIAYSSDADKGLIYIVWDGAVTPDEWYAHIRRMTADVAWPVANSLLVELSSVIDVSLITDEVIARAAAIYGEIPNQLEGKQAAFVASIMFAKAKEFERLVGRLGERSITFNTLDTACLYLGLDLVGARQVIATLRAKLRSG